MRKTGASFLVVLLCTILLVVPLYIKPAQAVTPKQNAINKGLAWLAKQQDPATGAWSLDYYPIASTAFAVTKFAAYKNETGDTTYDSNVTAGLHYLLSSGSSFQVDITADLAAHPSHWTGPGTPTSNGDGIGIYFRSTVGMNDYPVGSYTSTYETGIVMMALQAANKSGYINQNDLVPAGSDPAIVGKTYYTVMGDMVNFYAWAQNDPSCGGGGEGGWRYVPNMEDGGVWFAGPSSDNSVSQWPVLGLMAAEDWGILAPNYVKSELLNHWLAYSQNYPGNGGFGYDGPHNPTVPMTAAGLIELTYCGIPTSDPRWNAARSYIGNNWGSDNIGNMYAMYGVMKAAMTAQSGPVWTFGTHWWQNGTGEYDDTLVNASQNLDGSWPATFNRDMSPTTILATEWALLILEKYVPPPPHDVAVTKVVANRVWVYQGWCKAYSATINVTVRNLGGFNETVKVTLYYNKTATLYNNETVGTQIVKSPIGGSNTSTFVWNTAGVPYGPNYTMTAVATIPYDINLTNNVLVGPKIKVRILGDTNGDGKVDIRDLAPATAAFGSWGPNYWYPGSPPHPRWNHDVDIDNNGRIDIRDIALIAHNFGKHE